MFLTRRRGARAGIAALAAAMMLAACGGGSSGADGSSTGESTVTVFAGQTSTFTENFNPFSSTALASTLGVLYEPLYYYNLQSGADPESLLGAGYEWNDEGTELTITTREGVTWSDGEPFTAADVAFTFNLINKTAALNTSGLAATAEVVDDTHAVLKFTKQSFMQEPSVLGNTPIVPEHVWKDVADPTTDINAEPVGTGPFTLKSFSGQSYVLTANQTYWGGAPKVTNVRYIALDSADAAAAALTAGKVDWMSAYLPSIDSIIASGDDLSYVNTPAMTTVVVTCSNDDLGCEGPQTDPAVRTAIYQALDRAQLNTLAGGGVASVASPTLLLPDRDTSWITDTSLTTIPQDPDTTTAAQTLEDAGWVMGDDGVRVKDGVRLSMTIQTVTGWSDYISLNDSMTQQLAEVGIELKATQLSWNEWNSNQTKGTFQLSLDSIGLNASSNPYYTYDKVLNSVNTAEVGESASAGNTSRFADDTVDSLLADAAATTDAAEQKAIYAQIQQIMVASMPYIPIYVNSMLTEFNNTRATGWPTTEDPYVLPATWKAWDNGIVLKTITPVG